LQLTLKNQLKSVWKCGHFAFFVSSVEKKWGGAAGAEGGAAESKKEIEECIMTFDKQPRWK
jgi:hypothetical protein